MRILSLEYVAKQKNKKYLSLSHVPFKVPVAIEVAGCLEVRLCWSGYYRTRAARVWFGGGCHVNWSSSSRCQRQWHCISYSMLDGLNDRWN